MTAHPERLSGAFDRNRLDGRATFVVYLMAGDPDLETTLALMRGLTLDGGVDVLELGMPFSDPMAEGPSIQRAAQRSLAAGTRLADVLALIRRFRETDTVTPVVLMGYLNPVESYGHAAFARDAGEAGADGVILVDCPPEEAGPLVAEMQAKNLEWIPLVTPTTDAARLETVLQHERGRPARGFVYYVSVAGVTGVKAADAAAVAPEVARVKAATDLPVAVGFGIRTPDQAAAVARVADGVVVGSALVDEIARAAEANRPVVPAVVEAAARLGDAIREARLAPAEKER